MNRVLLSFLLLCCSGGLWSQSSNNTWIFGSNAGLDFNTTPPTPFTSVINALEGSAIMSDENGDLLFYTQGVVIYDKNFNPMPNGSGILGGASSTQAALIHPFPNSCSKYYVFTTEDHEGGATMRYTVVDMCLNGGLGDVVAGQKNILMATNVVEKLTAVLHQNGTDTWILTHELGNNEFLAFTVTPFGVNPTPVVSSVGATYNSSNYIGPIRASSDGSKVAAATTFNMTSVELFDFNNATGILTFDRDLGNYGITTNGAYGLEFSPNDDLLYVATCWGTSRLYQFDLATNTSVLLTSQAGNYHYGALQLGNDGRIYVARNLTGYLGVIANPDVSGTGCNYINNGIALASGTNSTMGLPNFSPYAFDYQQAQSNLFEDVAMSACSLVQLDVELDCNATVLWSTGSTDPQIQVTQPGTYVATVTNQCNVIVDSVVVTTMGTASVSLPPDSVFCIFPASGFTIQPVVEGSFGTTPVYQWSNGSTSTSLLAPGPGTYWVSVSTDCGVFQDTIVLTDDGEPAIVLDSTLDVCAGGYPVNVTAVVSGATSFSWSTGVANSTTITVSAPGTYVISATNDCGTATESIMVSTLGSPTVQLPAIVDTCLAAGQNLVLTPVLSNVNTVSWSDGSTANSISIGSSGTYTLVASNPCGSASATVIVTIGNAPELILPATIDTCFSAGLPIEIVAQGTAENYSWDTGETTPFLFVTEPGIYTCMASNSCGTVQQSVVVQSVPDAYLNADPHYFSYSCIDTIPIESLPLEYEGELTVWSASGQEVGPYISESGIYQIVVEGNCSTTYDSVYIDVGSEVSFYLPNTFTPDEDRYNLNEAYNWKGSLVTIDFIRIYNRWGEIVYSEDGQFSGWDGRYEGRPCPDGIYQVEIIYSDGCSQMKHRLMAHVNLLR